MTVNWSNTFNLEFLLLSSPLFGNDDTVADTFGTFFHPKDKEEEIDDDKTKKPVSGTKLPSKNDLIDEVYCQLFFSHLFTDILSE